MPKVTAEFHFHSLAVRQANRLATLSKTVSGNVFRAVFNANRPAADPSLRSTLFDLKPVP